MEDPPPPPPPPPPPEPEPAAASPRRDAEPSPPLQPRPRRRLLRLRCAVQHYEWGRRGDASLVARLAAQDPDPARPYAELWIGTHPSGPSTLLDDGELLGDWLARNLDALGPAVAARWGGDLPFLFKVGSPGQPVLPGLPPCSAVPRSVLLPSRSLVDSVNAQVLSVAKALSIQAHPDKKLAEVLHALRPSTYKDDNHKPEMAIAITEFRALCGFATIEVRV